MYSVIPDGQRRQLREIYIDSGLTNAPVIVVHNESWNDSFPMVSVVSEGKSTVKGYDRNDPRWRDSSGRNSTTGCPPCRWTA